MTTWTARLYPNRRGCQGRAVWPGLAGLPRVHRIKVAGRTPRITLVGFIDRNEGETERKVCRRQGGLSGSATRTEAGWRRQRRLSAGQRRVPRLRQSKRAEPVWELSLPGPLTLSVSVAPGTEGAPPTADPSTCSTKVHAEARRSHAEVFRRGCKYLTGKGLLRKDRQDPAVSHS